MYEYSILIEAARQIAVGLHPHIGAFVAAAKRDNADDYEQFVAEYFAKQAAQTPALTQRNNTCNSRAV